MVQVSSMKTSRLGSMSPDRFAIVCGGDLCPGDPARARQGSCFDRDADPAKEAAHHRGVGFDPSLGRKVIAEGLKRDVRFLGPRGLQKVPVRHQLGGAMAAVSDGLSRAVPFDSLKPFDRYG